MLLRAGKETGSTGDKNAWAARCPPGRRPGGRGVLADLTRRAFPGNAPRRSECPRTPARDRYQPLYITGTESQFHELRPFLSLSRTPAPHQEGAKRLSSFLRQARKLHGGPSSLTVSVSPASRDVPLSFCIGEHSVSSLTPGSRPWTESPS